MAASCSTDTQDGLAPCGIRSTSRSTTPRARRSAAVTGSLNNGIST